MKKPGDLAARLAVALVGIPVVLGALWAGGWVLSLLVALVAVLGSREFYNLARLRGAEPFDVMGSAAAGGLVLLAGAEPVFEPFAARALWIILAVGGASLARSLRARWPEGSPLAAFTSTLGGIVYVGLPLSFVPLLRALGDGALAEASGAPGAGFFVPMAFVLLPLLTTWAGDSAAYFVGRSIGRRPLTWVSPKKTWEGSLGSVLGSVAVSVLVGGWLGYDARAMAGFGLVADLSGQGGDLIESYVKRALGVKDSAKTFGEIGGVLDLLDALLLSAPAAFLWAHLIVARGGFH
mgnify:CR=1 FL=1